MESSIEQGVEVVFWGPFDCVFYPILLHTEEAMLAATSLGFHTQRPPAVFEVSCPHMVTDMPGTREESDRLAEQIRQVLKGDDNHPTTQGDLII